MYYDIVLLFLFGIGSANSFSHYHGSLSLRNNASPSANQIFFCNTRLQARVASPNETEDPVATTIDDTLDDDVDELVDSLTEKMDDLEGLWYSDDFYGSHGREWVKVSATLVGEFATSALVATKVTGDLNVPAGCVTFQTKSWAGVGTKVTAQIQVRADPKDPNGFSWLPGELTMIAKNEMRLLCYYSPFIASEGTFYKQTCDEEGDDSE